jgi:hypothetical protein
MVSESGGSQIYKQDKEQPIRVRPSEAWSGGFGLTKSGVKITL